MSDRRINSSHGNNIFIFQGQRFFFFPSSDQIVDRQSFAWLWKKKRESAVEMRRRSLHQALWVRRKKKIQTATCGKCVSH